MSMRIQEIHPSLVHFPIALLPTSLAADALGRLTGSRALMEVGRRTIPLAAASAAIAGVFGLIAQESVNVEPGTEAHDLVTTHRTLNLGLIAMSAVMALKRSRRRRPSLGYLAAGLAGTLTMTYSAYLGGHMVYELGVGVKKAGGILEGQAPEILPDNVREVAQLSREHLRAGARHAMEEAEQGRLVPSITRSYDGQGAIPAPAT